ncbi:hypothetical protein D3C75_610890 [compost metagenome]
MLHLHDSVGGRKGPLHPFQIAQLRRNADGFAARFHRTDAQDILRQPGCWTGGPAVAQAVPVALVAIAPVGAVHIHLALRSQLIDPRCILQPADIEILPEGGGSQRQHASPVGPDAVQAAADISRFSARLQNVVSVEGGIPLGRFRCNHLFIGCARVKHPNQGQ